VRLAGKVAIVTGASRGIGRAIALALAREGCDVTLAAKTVEPNPKLPGTLGDVAREVESLGRRALAVQTDVRDVLQIEAMVQATVDAFGRVDILVNNAGALWWQPMLETPPKRFDLVMGVNVRAAFFGCRAVLPHMIRQGSGHIVNMSPPIDLSVVPNRIAYMISKFGMTMVALGLAEEVRDAGVGACALWPATIIESQATINYHLGDPSMWRKADILADAILAIVTSPPLRYTGKALIDEDVLAENGVTDFDRYACVPGSKPLKISWNVLGG
jgi:citronellol/citronellal dehydrogenase